MVLTGFLTAAILLILFLIFFPSKLHLFEMLCIWLAAAYFTQSISVILTNNLQWIVLAKSTSLAFVEIIKDVFVVPLSIVVTVHLVRGKAHLYQVLGLLVLIVLVFMNDMILLQTGVYQFTENWGLVASFLKSVGIVLLSLLCHLLYRRILIHELR